MSMWKWGCLVFLLAVGSAGIYGYNLYDMRFPSTENAYIDAATVQVAAQVSGAVDSVGVHSQQPVARGSELLVIDQTLYRAALKRAEAKLALAGRSVEEHRAALLAADASVTEARVRLENARNHWLRVKRLQPESFLSADALEEAEASFKRAQADLDVVTARREQAAARLRQIGGVDGLIAQAQADVDQARWELQQTVLRAPCDGITEDVGVHNGESVQAHKPLFVLVCGEQYWVKANFKETELGRIRPGQSVDIEVDMYPGQAFHGVVESISPASGTAFSLLPPENATGNWVKVTQRVPVRIRITDAGKQWPLRIGTSAHVRIDAQDS